MKAPLLQACQDTPTRSTRRSARLSGPSVSRPYVCGSASSVPPSSGGLELGDWVTWLTGLESACPPPRTVNTAKATAAVAATATAGTRRRRRCSARPRSSSSSGSGGLTATSARSRNSVIFWSDMTIPPFGQGECECVAATGQPGLHKSLRDPQGPCPLGHVEGGQVMQRDDLALTL